MQLEGDLMQRCIKTFSEEGRHSSQHVSNLTLLQNRVCRSSEECFSSLLLLNGFSDPYTWTFLPIWASASSVTVATGSSRPSVSLTLKLEHFAVTCRRTRIQTTLFGAGAQKGCRSSHSGLYYFKASRHKTDLQQKMCCCLMCEPWSPAIKACYCCIIAVTVVIDRIGFDSQPSIFSPDREPLQVADLNRKLHVSYFTSSVSSG